MDFFTLAIIFGCCGLAIWMGTAALKKKDADRKTGETTDNSEDSKGR